MKFRYLVLAVLLVIALSACNKAQENPAPALLPVAPAPTPAPELAPAPTPNLSPAVPPPPAAEASSTTINVTAQKFSFAPAEIRVKEGQKVNLVVKSIDVTHGILIPAFDLNLKLKPGETASGSFVASKKGKFPFLCSVFCGEGHGGMRGKLIVE